MIRLVTKHAINPYLGSPTQIVGLSSELDMGLVIANSYAKKIDKKHDDARGEARTLSLKISQIKSLTR
jgi:hypothetical protein